jgi:hypothetical protein
VTEQEMRILVREAIARALPGSASVAAVIPDRAVRMHASHAMFVLPAGADADGPCIIEPAVACNHCGYCKSYGH